MITDPSWLYSTIAQSSAAIVAIVGGFITASVLARRAEKTSMRKELDYKKERLKQLNTIPYLIPKRKLTDEQKQNMEEEAYSEAREKTSLKYAISNLEARLKAFSYPPHLGWGVLMLIYLALFSILFPVGFILTETFSLTSKLFVFVMFALGLVALFAYIGVQVNELRRK